MAAKNTYPVISLILQASVIPPQTDGDMIVLEASTVGLSPGVWPDEVWIEDGEKGCRRYDYNRRIRDESGVVAVVYMRDHDGTEVHILND